MILNALEVDPGKVFNGYYPVKPRKVTLSPLTNSKKIDWVIVSNLLLNRDSIDLTPSLALTFLLAASHDCMVLLT